MRSLSKSDLKAAMQFMGAVYETDSIEEYAERVCELLPRLIDSDFVSYNELNRSESRALVIMEPQPSWIAKRFPDFERTVATHPYMVHFLKTGEQEAHRIQDLVSQSGFAETPVYQEFYKALSVKDQIVTFLASDQDQSIGIALTRTVKGFTAEHRDLCNFLRAHLLSAYKCVRRTTDLRRKVQVLETALKKRDGAVAISASDGRLVHLSPEAREVLRRWFGQSWSRSDRLPSELMKFIPETGKQIRQISFVKGGRRLTICGIPFEEHYSLLFSEDVDPLAVYGLSGREMEILEWVAEGKRNEEIGKILAISAGTVKRHVDHILKKLSVETRSSAASIFYRARI